MNNTLGDTLLKGINNPDCGFFVGYFTGSATVGSMIIRVVVIYYAIKLLDKLLFTGLPKLYQHSFLSKKSKWKRKTRTKKQ